MKTTSSVLTLLLAAIDCDSPVDLKVPTRAPDHEGVIVRVEPQVRGQQILIDLGGQGPCMPHMPSNAVFYMFEARTLVVRRSADGALRNLPTDSLLVDQRVKVWHNDLPALDRCPPMYASKAIEVLRQ